jgi:hypothetical protein
MTLKQVIQAIERAAALQPSVRHIVRNDVFRLNEITDAQYGVFAWTQQQHTIGDELHYFAFAFFYVDRLTDNRSNEIEVQSVGIDTLSGILRRLETEDIIAVGTVTAQTFNQRFADECAGAWCNVRLEVPAETVCPDDNKEINIM